MGSHKAFRSILPPTFSSPSQLHHSLSKMVSFTAIFATVAAAASVAVASPVARSNSGQATFFYQNGNPGACGNYNKDSAKVVALDYRMYSNGDHCGKTVKVTNTANGKSVVATVADMCPSCASSGSLDLSTGAFDVIGAQDTGVLPISWDFVDASEAN